jgi:hypothetical protein
MALLSGVARAQAEPPAPAPAPGPATSIVPPGEPATASPATALPAEALPAPASASVAPADATAPTLTPEPVPGPPLALDQGRSQEPVGGRPVPFYRKDWFWGAIGVAILTTAALLVSTASSGADTPSTTLGNMRAF